LRVICFTRMATMQRAVECRSSFKPLLSLHLKT
jgi:hypothetical protein